MLITFGKIDADIVWVRENQNCVRSTHTNELKQSPSHCLRVCISVCIEKAACVCMRPTELTYVSFSTVVSRPELCFFDSSNAKYPKRNKNVCFFRCSLITYLNRNTGSKVPKLEGETEFSAFEYTNCWVTVFAKICFCDYFAISFFIFHGSLIQIQWKISEIKCTCMLQMHGKKWNSTLNFKKLLEWLFKAKYFKQTKNKWFICSEMNSSAKIIFSHYFKCSCRKI